MLAMYYETRDGEGKGREYLEGMAAKDPTGAAGKALGWFLVQRQKNDEAIGVYRKILERDPSDMLATYGLGRAVFASRQNLDEAVRCFQRFLGKPAPPGPVT